MTRDQKIYRMAYVLASLFIGVLLLSGYHKVLYPADFALTVFRFHLLPDAVVNAAALYFPWLEIVCGVCLLLIPGYRVAALWTALVLLVVFSVGIAVILLRGSAINCGCFSSSPLAKPMDGLSIARNVGLILLAVMALAASRKAR